MTLREEEAFHKIISDWVFKAEQDFRVVQVLLDASPPCRYAACFHAQQSVEKFLKALLTWEQVEFPKTHAIGVLLDLLQTVHPDVAEDLADSVALSPYGVEIRYPGDQPEPSLSETKKALVLAQKVRESILPLLPS